VTYLYLDWPCRLSFQNGNNQCLPWLFKIYLLRYLKRYERRDDVRLQVLTAVSVSVFRDMTPWSGRNVPAFRRNIPPRAGVEALSLWNVGKFLPHYTVSHSRRQ
jgi:hypothetical protein